MTVVVNDVALTPFLRSTFGPVGQYLALRGNEIVEEANRNASGLIIGIETGDLIGGIRATIESDADGLFLQVGSDARHRGFAYPTFHDQHGRPWLTLAIETVMRRWLA